jgi:hypothetical protein
MYNFYTQVVFEELRNQHTKTIHLKLQEELNLFKLGSVYGE